MKKNIICLKSIYNGDGVSRNLTMTLPEYFVNGLLECYKITNEELKEEW
ncbi:hypothetical protein [Tenacibaculum mesophilum]